MNNWMLRSKTLTYFLSASLCPILATQTAMACCSVSSRGKAVVNADQNVIIIWDPAQQTEHFIRQASFKSETKDVGFLVPTPSRPQLEEAGDIAFQTLEKITKPKEPINISLPIGCSAKHIKANRSSVVVIEQKRVAGFDATVLRADNGKDLAEWLSKNGYHQSPEVASWAQPYTTDGWMFVALKVAQENSQPTEGKPNNLHASSLRISFKTQQPLFPYREPDSSSFAKKLETNRRLLRIYFISDQEYEGTIANNDTWSGNLVWSADISKHRKQLLEQLKLPSDTGPHKWWLTKFDDYWPYQKAAGDLYFTPNLHAKSPHHASFSLPMSSDLSLIGFFAIGAARLWFRRRN